MRIRTLNLIAIALLTAACDPGLSLFDESVGAIIKKDCDVETTCTIRLRDATNFDWDEMYVLRPGVLDVEARKYLPEVGILRGEFNRKIVFFKNGRRVSADEAPTIIEGEHTPPGMIFFEDGDGNPDCLRFASDAQFNVRKEKWLRGEVYHLSCSNCVQSPVFAEFGEAVDIINNSL